MQRSSGLIGSLARTPIATRARERTRLPLGDTPFDEIAPEGALWLGTGEANTGASAPCMRCRHAAPTCRTDIGNTWRCPTRRVLSTRRASAAVIARRNAGQRSESSAATPSPAPTDRREAHGQKRHDLGLRHGLNGAEQPGRLAVDAVENIQ